jgi:hypothetical protein
MYNDHNLLSTCNMIWSIIKSSTNEIDSYLWLYAVNRVSIRMRIRIRNICFEFVYDNIRIRIWIRNKMW